MNVKRTTWNTGGKRCWLHKTTAETHEKMHVFEAATWAHSISWKSTLFVQHFYFNVYVFYFCRKFLQDVMEDTLNEVVSKRSFDSLVRAVNFEKEKKAGLQQKILK